MSKQDGYSPRTAADLERKYNFGQSFAEVYGLAGDARKAAEEAELAAEEAKKAIDGLDAEAIFLRLTGGGTDHGVYRGADGKIYINAEYIASGTLSADRIATASINGDKIVSNSITSTQIAANAITASEIAANAVTSAKIAANAITADHISAGVISALAIEIGDDEDFQTTIVDGYLETYGIAAEYISSGTLDADYVSIGGLLEFHDWGDRSWVEDPSGYIGLQPNTGAIVVTSASGETGFYATDESAMLVYDNSTEVMGVSEDGCFASSPIGDFSDRTLKNSISYDLDTEEALFAKLRPCSYAYNSDKKSKKWWGFIAQDLQESAEEVGMDVDTLGVLGRYNDKMTISYGAITALNTHMIQKLIARVAALEEKLA
jgi:hypothetical protein